MANKTGKSYPNGWGGYDHYDSNGKKTGYSMPSAWGGYDTYDSHLLLEIDGQKKALRS